MDIIGELDNESVLLYDTMENNIFTDIDYYAVINNCPMFMRDAGNSPECGISQSIFAKWCSLNNNYITHKMLYYNDFEMLIGAFQNRYSVINPLLDNLYRILSPNINFPIENCEQVMVVSNHESSMTHSFISSLFINLNSAFDLITKICYELQELHKIKFNVYPKLKCCNITYGDKHKLVGNVRIGTIFQDPELEIVKKVRTIRDEFIHNGSLDFSNNLYDGDYQGNGYKWIMFPDMNYQGHFVKFVNRKKFYSDTNNTFNSILPDIVLEVSSELLKTVKQIRNIYDRKRYCNPNDILKYKDDIRNWHDSFVDIMKKNAPIQ